MGSKICSASQHSNLPLLRWGPYCPSTTTRVRTVWTIGWMHIQWKCATDKLLHNITVFSSHFFQTPKPWLPSFLAVSPILVGAQMLESFIHNSNLSAWNQCVFAGRPTRQDLFTAETAILPYQIMYDVSATKLPLTHHDLLRSPAQKASWT